jgi:hypothetical protein
VMRRSSSSSPLFCPSSCNSSSASAKCFRACVAQGAEGRACMVNRRCGAQAASPLCLGECQVLPGLQTHTVPWGERVQS